MVVLYCLLAGYILGRVTGRGTARFYIAPRSTYATIEVETHISLSLKEGTHVVIMNVVR